MLMLIITILYFGSTVSVQSTENILPISPVNDPFYDPYVDKIVHLNRSALLAIPRMDDEAFLHSLYVQSPVRTYRMIESVSKDKSDDQMIEQTQIDKQWETLVLSGPLSINYLGALLVLSSHRDFGFALPAPEFSYKYIRYPNSFRATLTQLSGEMYDAFLTGHTSMDQIQMFIQQIPNNIRTTLKVITQASPRLIQSILPSSLTNIERIINDCIRITNNTANKFGLTTKLLQEIIEMTGYTQSWNHNLTIAISTAINESFLQQANNDRERNETRKRYEEAQQALKEAHQAYNDAVNNIPTRAPVSKITMAPTQPPVHIPNSPTVGSAMICIFTFGIACGSLDSQVNAYNNAIQRERERQADIKAIEEAYDSDKEAERQRITREEKIIEEKRQDAATRLKMLEASEKAYDASYREFLEKENTLASSIIRISKLKLAEMNLEQTMKILVNATVELTKIKAEWDALTRFFLGLSNQVSLTHGVLVHEFVNIIRSTMLAPGEPLNNATLEFFTELLIEPVDLVDRHAHLFYVIAKTYYDISSAYMMKQIAGITGFLAAQTTAERENLLQQIGVSTLELSAKISRLSQERSEEYHQKVTERRRELSAVAYVPFIR